MLGAFGIIVRRCPTLPQGPPCSTIGAESLSFWVRNVTRRFPLAMAAETLATSAGEPGLCSFVAIPDREVSDANSLVVNFSIVYREPQSGRESSGHPSLPY